VAEEVGDHDEVGATADEGGRKGVPADVGGGVFFQSGQPVVFSEKSSLHAVFAGQLSSTEVLRER
jgi:hypothetical protein